MKKTEGIEEAVRIAMKVLAEGDEDARREVIDKLPSFLVGPLLDAMFPNFSAPLESDREADR